MLVLSRKKNESVMIDDRIQVIVLGTRGENIILGFNADPNIPVHREEVYQRYKKDNSVKQENFKIVSPVIKNKQKLRNITKF